MKEQNKEVVQINEEKHDNREKQVLIQGELNIPQQQEPVEQKEVLPARESIVAIREDTIDRVWQNMPEKAKNKRSRLYKKRNNAFILGESEDNAISNDEDFLARISEKKEVTRLLDSIFLLDITEKSVESDEAIVQNSISLEKLLGRLALFSEMPEAGEYIDGLSKERRDKTDEKLTRLRRIAAYYVINKDIMSDEYYRKNYTEDIKLDVSEDSTDEESAIAKKLMVKNRIKKTLFKKVKDPSLSYVYANDMYEDSAIYNTAEAQMDMIKEALKAAKERHGGASERLNEDNLPQVFDEVMAQREKYLAMPTTTKKQWDSYNKQKKKYYELYRDSMKEYVEGLEDSQKIKLTKEEKNYINLLTDLSYQVDVDKNGFHNNTRIEKIAVLLDKIKSDPCYERHNRFVPSFLKRRLSVGSEDKLSALIAEFDAMQTDKKWEELKKAENGAREQNLELTKEGEDAYIQVSGNTGVCDNIIEEITSHCNFMDYMGLGKNIQKTGLKYAASMDNKRHWGYKLNKRYSESDKTINGIKEKKEQGIKQRFVFTTDTICTLSSMSIMNVLMGSDQVDFDNDMFMISNVADFSHIGVKKNKPEFVGGTLSHTYLIQNVYMENKSGFTKKRAENLKDIKAITLPVLEAEFVEKVLAMKPEDLYEATGGLVDKEQVYYFGERLRYIQSLLKKRKEEDEKLPENERTILGRADWQKSENKERMERLLQGDTGQLCSTTLKGRIEIEGASHESVDRKEDSLSDEEKLEERIYNDVKGKLKKALDEAKTLVEKINVFSSFNTVLAYYPDYPYKGIYKDIQKMLMETVCTVEFLEVFFKERMALFFELYDKVEANLNDPKFVVPEDFRTESRDTSPEAVKKHEDNMRLEYAIYKVADENPELIERIGVVDSFSFDFNGAVFRNKSMDHDVDAPYIKQKEINKKIILSQEGLLEKFETSFGKYKPMIGNFSHIKKEKNDVIVKKLYEKGQEIYGSFFKIHGLLNDPLPEHVNKQLSMYDKLVELRKNNDVDGAVKLIREYKKSGDANAMEVVHQYLDVDLQGEIDIWKDAEPFIKKVLVGAKLDDISDEMEKLHEKNDLAGAAEFIKKLKESIYEQDQEAAQQYMKDMEKKTEDPFARSLVDEIKKYDKNKEEAKG